MSQNTPTTSSDEEFFSPAMVKLMAHPDTIARIDQRLFPLTNETIDEMPKYLETVNTIIKN